MNREAHPYIDDGVGIQLPIYYQLLLYYYNINYTLNCILIGRSKFGELLDPFIWKFKARFIKIVHLS